MANEEQLRGLLQQAAAKLGMSENQLLQSAQNGSLAQQLQQNQQNEALRRVLSDPKEAQKLLNTPQAQKLMQLLQGNGPKQS